jgi:sterol desaturase/sphingolipid hydroxylase (fatty acid hydroxylase superfamily)
MSVFETLGEPAVRLIAFAVVFATMVLCEVAWPKRSLRAPRVRRWATNLSIVALGIATVRAIGFVGPSVLAVGAAAWADAKGWGLLHALSLPGWIGVCVALLVLDFAIWLQHVASHHVALLWRLHQVHHADVDIDATTALRFHPIEIGLSMLYKSAWVVALGPSVLAVVLFEIILNSCAMFNHANINLPPWLDRGIRTLVVTPDMHRVHHSVIGHEHNSNFGFNLSIWDRLFQTYTDQPAHGHAGMTIGLPTYQSSAPTHLGWSLRLPFVSRRP